MPNLAESDYVFSNEIGKYSYKIYYNLAELRQDAVLLTTRLADVLICRREFNSSDASTLFNSMQRVLMNIITFRLDYALMYEYNSSNFLQPVELLGGQSLCDLVLEHQHDVGDGLSAIQDQTRERLSIME